MKLKTLTVISFTTLLVISFMLNTFVDKKTYRDLQALPSLPRPIAKEMVLITSAGQSTDAYMIKDIANKLMLHNFFMPQAVEPDLENINTVVFVAGYSDIGEKLQEISFQDEKKRIDKLLNSVKEKEIPIITIYIGGNSRRNRKTDMLLKMTCKESDYIISTTDSNYDQFLSNLAKEHNIPITLVEDIRDITEPFVSAFR
ncbi:hypothetical protein SAMN05446037_1011134 [Anaerovirgula multivorans]|uniref:DUF6305 domain-containing protein n=1 Tax=Anaerovirgula multivorans TaxID=312168 RepID=A0A239F331_9FIRM|nr:DUF6305 family protein [Anaerovirgula multivorans]SNS50514.1 hypothetical protein SAMN05446037_1011134 [Anaerovirgula multivorans]